MSEGNYRMSAAKKKRAKTMKKLTILIFIISVITCVCCFWLFKEVRALDEALHMANTQLTNMNELVLAQQEYLEDLTEQLNGQTEYLQLMIQDRNTESSNTNAENETEELNMPQAVENGNVGSGNIESVDIGSGNLEGEETELQINPMEAAHKVYLTFDDGPSIYTEEILEILDQYGVKATFFVVGKENDVAKNLLRKIVENGHSLGMHSYSHDYAGIYESVDSFAEDFEKLQDYLYEVTGVTSMIYRFPGGSSNIISDIDMYEFASYLQKQDVTFYDWNISSGDGGSMQLSTKDLVSNCTKDIKNWNTSIVLLHDSADKRSTVDALPEILETILAMEDTVILPITEETNPVQHIDMNEGHIDMNEGMEE